MKRVRAWTLTQRWKTRWLISRSMLNKIRVVANLWRKKPKTISHLLSLGTSCRRTKRVGELQNLPSRRWNRRLGLRGLSMRFSRESRNPTIKDLSQRFHRLETGNDSWKKLIQRCQLNSTRFLKFETKSQNLRQRKGVWKGQTLLARNNFPMCLKELWINSKTKIGLELGTKGWFKPGEMQS